MSISNNCWGKGQSDEKDGGEQLRSPGAPHLPFLRCILCKISCRPRFPMNNDSLGPLWQHPDHADHTPRNNRHLKIHCCSLWDGTCAQILQSSCKGHNKHKGTHMLMARPLKMTLLSIKKSFMYYGKENGQAQHWWCTQDFHCKWTCYGSRGRQGLELGSCTSDL